MQVSTSTPDTPTTLNRWVLPLAAAAQFMLALDFAIINVALATVQKELHFAAADLQWVVSGYALTYGAFLMAGGRLGDKFGLRRMLIMGIIIFGTASLAGGLSPTPLWLVISRLIQGIGAALVAPAALGMVSDTYTEQKARARAVSLFQGSVAVGGVAGLVFGGVLTATAGWRWVLLVNPPIMVILLLLILVKIGQRPGKTDTSIDVRGATALTVTIGAIIFAVTQLQHEGAGSAEVWIPAAVAVASALIFITTERHAQAPLVTRTLLGKGRWRVLISTVTLGSSMAAYAYFVALYLQRQLHWSAAEAGFAFLPNALTGLIVSILIAPRLLPKIGLRVPLMVSFALLALGQLWLSRLPEHGSYGVDVLIGTIPIAAGLGLAFPAAALLLVQGVPEGSRGVSSALFATGQQTGSAVGLAALATIAALPAPSSAAGYDRAFVVSACIALAGGLLVVPRRSNESDDARNPKK